MAGLIEDYALIGDMQSAALVNRDGCVDWLCLPRFDSDACFAALLGDEANGQWRISPAEAAGPPARRGESSRQYAGDTLILETLWHTMSGTVKVTDFMPPRDGEQPILVRIVEGVSGAVEMDCVLRVRFGYGAIVPWMRRVDHCLSAVAGPDAVWLRTPVRLIGRSMRHEASFTVRAGERVPFVLCWMPSHAGAPSVTEKDADDLLDKTRAFWADWAARCTYQGDYAPAVLRSLITLKALTYAPTGGIVAAATTSLPEDLGGVRNWDYRYCWLRDATITLEALLRTGYTAEAAAWREWLERAVAGSARDVQIMYGVAGERRLAEWEASWLPGYEHSAPVRIGNAAVDQRQLDVYGEVIDAITLGKQAGLRFDKHTWALVRQLLEFLEKHWDEPDEGIWEVRGPRRHFVHSKIMAWVAFDRACQVAELTRYGAALERWPRSATRSTRRSATAATTRPGAPSPSTTAAPSWMPRCCCSSRSASCRPMTRGSSRPCGPSSATWSGTAWCSGTPSRPRPRPGRRPGRGGRPARRRGRLPGLQLLAGQRPAPDRRLPGRGRAVRAAADPAQRRRAAQRGVRPPLRPPGREHAAGLQPRAADPGRPQPAQP